LDVLKRLWLNELSSLNYSPATLRAYERDLDTWILHLAFKQLPFDPLEVAEVKDWIAKLRGQELSIKTIKRRISACREFYRWAKAGKKTSANPFADLPRIRAEKRLPKFVEVEGIPNLMKAAAKSSGRKKVHAERNLAIVETIYSTGCRLDELHRLSVGDVSAASKTILLFGKGRKERRIPIGDKALDAIAAYLPIRKTMLEQRERFYEEALFVSERGGRLSRDAIQDVVANAGAKAGIKLHPHMLRHSYGTHVSDGGADLSEVQELLGHANPQTSRIYTHLSGKRLQKVYRRTHPRA
jgi:site-specific recombinase XerD